MNIFVCVKQVPDTETKIQVRPDGNYIETSSIKWVMNPYDEFAVEQALLIKAKQSGTTVTVVRVGSVQTTEALRTAMAMGADKSILVEADDNLDSYTTAKALKSAIEKSGETPDLILTGKQAVDDDCMQVPQLLAQMMELPSVTVISGCELNGDELTLKRETEGGTVEVYTANKPCVVAATKGLNVPRYASLPGIMKAKRKPLTKHGLADLGITESDRRVKTSSYHLPPEKPPGKKFDATGDADKEAIVAEVVNFLRTEAKVI